jgi:hypothetical protein
MHACMHKSWTPSLDLGVRQPFGVTAGSDLLLAPNIVQSRVTTYRCEAGHMWAQRTCCKKENIEDDVCSRAIP